jgi:ribonuclease VapC
VIVETSAVIAIVRREPERDDFLAALDRSPTNRLSAASYVEAAIVVDGSRDPALSRYLDELLAVSNITVEPVTERQARIAREAYRDYGKGSGHSARLNFVDCFAYALARDRNEPLLFKGDDFRHTDIRPAIP